MIQVYEVKKVEFDISLKSVAGNPACWLSRWWSHDHIEYSWVVTADVNVLSLHSNMLEQDHVREVLLNYSTSKRSGR